MPESFISRWLGPTIPAGIENWDASLVSEWRQAVADQAYDNASAAGFGSFSAALVVVGGLRNEIHPAILGSWAILISICALVWTWHVSRWRKAPTDAETFSRNAYAFSLQYMIIGTLWASTAVAIPMVHETELQLLLGVVIVGVTAGSVSVFSLALRPTWIFLGITIPPMAIAIGLCMPELGPMLAGGLVAHLAYTAYCAGTVNRTSVSSLAHRFANAQLVSEISESKRNTEQLNARLGEQISVQKEVEKSLMAARDQAELAARSKAEFLANMSHEIRTPMNGVLGMTELMLGTELNRKQRHFARTIHRSGEALLGIINDILDFSKIEAGKLELQALVFDLQQLMEDIGVMFAERAHRARLELQVIFPPAAHAIYRGDPDRLRQILTNLVGNALKFTERGDIILRVRIEPPENDIALLRFEVKDTGIGIDAENRDRIFDSFAQADSSTTKRFGGTGLGLAICKRLTTLMGGTIGVNSEPGRGSNFWFTCPLPMADPSALGRRRTVRPLLTGRRILIADAHPVSREALVSQLENWKARAVAVTSAEAAVAHMMRAAKEGEPIELLLFDRKISDDALDFALEVRRNPRIPRPQIVVLGQIDSLAETGQWFDAGISSYLSKPVRQSELYDAIADALDLTRPLTAISAEPQENTKAAELPRFDARILAVEDNPVNQELVRLLLENLGCRVTLAANGKEAVDTFTGTPLDELYDPFAAVLMDVQMPIMDGFAATAAIRAYESEFVEGKRVPIIALTANALEGDRERCLKAQMDDYLAKPFSQRQLATTLAQWLPQVGSSPDGTQEIETKLGTNTQAAPVYTGGAVILDPLALGRISALQRDGAPSVLGRVIELYFESAPVAMSEIREAVEGWNPSRLEHAAHSLKSSSANLGAAQMVELCRELELMGRERRVETADPMLRALEIAYRSTRAALDQERRKLGI